MKWERGKPSHFPPQHLNPNLHPTKSEPFLTQVFQRGADMIYRVVDAEEAVMGVWGLETNALHST